ncbi:hypothetical protein [Geomonas sp.]|uniref:hypothetical protein n=1 Tax=Geomonas sp. TaxID=2651584 RepID=UPI002B4A0961|nr:hypothetical protein [Geomonas sp.]
MPAGVRFKGRVYFLQSAIDKVIVCVEDQSEHAKSLCHRVKQGAIPLFGLLQRFLGIFALCHNACGTEPFAELASFIQENRIALLGVALAFCQKSHILLPPLINFGLNRS